MITEQEIRAQSGNQFPPDIDSPRDRLSMPVSVSKQVGGVADGNRKRALRRLLRLQFHDVNPDRGEYLLTAAAALHNCRYAKPAATKFVTESSDRSEMAKPGTNLPRKDDMRHPGCDLKRPTRQL